MLSRFQVTIKHGDPKQLLNALASENRIAIGNFVFTDTPLQLGHLKVILIHSRTLFIFCLLILWLIYLQGNRFRLALRNVLAEESLIEAKLNSFKDNGFINYYGAQRFGTRELYNKKLYYWTMLSNLIILGHVPTHVIGKSLLLGKWQEVS